MISLKLNKVIALALVLCSFLGAGLFAFKKLKARKTNTTVVLDTLTEDQRRLPKYAFNGLELAEGLSINNFASEPMLLNPTNIDVDANGRVWVLEAYNYRPQINGNPTKKEGDRIVILEDKNNDGKADTSKVFYQGAEINSPLGIAVLGNKVYVSQSPYVWVFTDENGDDVADKKEILFEGAEGVQHDHGMHAMVFGPDGKLYFNFGNEGKQLKDKNGKVVINTDGKAVNAENYKQGVVFRCDIDGSNVEVLAQNFRNSFELAVDSYGTMWASDNDDDGNMGTRITYVMPHGNYGFTDEMTGAGWRAPRVNMEDSIPFKHWHLNDPGTIPNVLQTGSGSPSGIMVYEGNLLPKGFQNQMIHAEPGHNVLRAYPVTNKGAGYSATILNIAENRADQWFKPIDVCAAPDGSIFVADWYDSGVGGHNAEDQTKGRVYRIAPTNSPIVKIKNDFNTIEGAIIALQSPNQATRYLAFTALQKYGDTAIPLLENLYNKAENPRMRARAFWLLAKSTSAKKYINLATKDADPNLRIVALRASKLFNINSLEVVKTLMRDADPQVKRECILSLRGSKEASAPSIWAQLAAQHDGTDRWNLEALGIAAQGQESVYLNEYLKSNKNPIATTGGQDILWRSRAPEALPFLASMANNSNVKIKDRLRFFRSFDFIKSDKKPEVLLKMFEAKSPEQKQVNKLVLELLDDKVVKSSPIALTALKEVVNSLPLNEDYITLVDKFAMADQKNRLYNAVLKMEGPGECMFVARSLLNLGGAPMLQKAINTSSETERLNTLQALRWVNSNASVAILKATAEDKNQSEKVRKTAYRHMAESYIGEDVSFKLLKAKKIPKEFIASSVNGLNTSWKKNVRDEARKYLGEAKSGDGKKLPEISELVRMKGDVTKGALVFKNYCTACHQVGENGMDYGPKLTQIGAKLTKEAIYSSIFHPDLGISFGYEGWDITLKDGTVMSGIIASKTETDIILKMPGGVSQNIKTSNIKTIKQLENSVMPAGLQEGMSTQELVDMVEYLKSLK